MENLPRNYLLYDGDCPFCTNYVRMVQLRKAVGPVALLNMRDHPDLSLIHICERWNSSDEPLIQAHQRQMAPSRSEQVSPAV